MHYIRSAADVDTNTIRSTRRATCTCVRFEGRCSFCPFAKPRYRVCEFKHRANTVHTRLFPVTIEYVFGPTPNDRDTKNKFQRRFYVAVYRMVKTRRFGPAPWVSSPNPKENTIFSIKRDTPTPTISLFI